MFHSLLASMISDENSFLHWILFVMCTYVMCYFSFAAFRVFYLWLNSLTTRYLSVSCLLICPNWCQQSILNL